MNLAKGGRRPDAGRARRPGRLRARGLLGLFVFAVALGALAAINSWDLPTYFGILLCALVIRAWSADRQVRPLTTLARFIAIAGLGLLLYAPFFQNYQALSVGIGLTTTRTTLADYWQMFGLFLFLVASYLVVEGLGGPEPLSRGARLAVRRWEQLPRVVRLRGALSQAAADAAWHDGGRGRHGEHPPERPRRSRLGPAPWGLWIAGWTALAAIVLWLAGLHLFAVLLPLLVLTVALALRRGQSPETLFTLLLIFTALLISLGVEVVYLKDFLGGGDYARMNTLFKFYIQVWVFLGIASAVALARLSGALAATGRRVLSPALGRAPGSVKAAWWTVLAVLLLSVAVYPLAGTAARVNDRFPGARPEVGTLDGMAFMSVGTYTWENRTHRAEVRLRRHPVAAVERPGLASGGRGGHRLLPRVRRAGGLVHRACRPCWACIRASSATTRRWASGTARPASFFTEPDYARVADLAKRLHIKYIYVGQLERIVYPAAGLAKFDKAVGTYLDLVYENPRTKIYQVR